MKVQNEATFNQLLAQKEKGRKNIIQARDREIENLKDFYTQKAEDEKVIGVEKNIEGQLYLNYSLEDTRR